MTPEVDVLVVCAGPHGLAMATRLQARRPDRHRRGDLMVVDPTGQWMVAWSLRFAAHAIPHLRSPGVHGPDTDRSAIFAFAQRTGRFDQLADPFAVPTTALFADHSADVAERHDLDRDVKPASVASVEPTDHGARVELTDGTRLTARRVVLAGNSARAHLPDWAQRVGGIHAGDLDVTGWPPSGANASSSWAAASPPSTWPWRQPSAALGSPSPVAVRSSSASSTPIRLAWAQVPRWLRRRARSGGSTWGDR